MNEADHPKESVAGTEGSRRRLSAWAFWGLLTVFWGAVTILFSAHDVLGQIINNQPPHWAGAFRWAAGWLLWIPLTALCWHLARRIPLHNGKWKRSVLLLLLIGMAVVGVFCVLEAILLYWLSRWAAMPIPFQMLLVKMLFWKLQANLLTFAVVMGTAYAVQYYRQYRLSELALAQQSLRAAELERASIRARLQALNAQLQPHFLFNAHQAISGLILNGEKERAVQMLAELSDLLRHTLKGRDTLTVPLREELDGLGHYLAIQQTRFGDRLRVEITTPPDTLDFHVPRLLLQPLVENAVKHGIEKASTTGTIRICASRSANGLQLAVENSGPSRNGHAVPQHEGVGLGNTRARLQQLYGTASRLDMDFPGGGGARVIVRLPEEAKPICV